MGFKVVQVVDMPAAPTPDYRKMLEQAGHEVGFSKVNCITEDDIIGAACEADAVIGVATFQPFSRKVVEKLTKCRMIMSIGIGYDHLDLKAATDYGILAVNVPDYCLGEMSDHAMALILSCTRKVVRLNQIVKDGGWGAEQGSEIQRSIWPSMSRLEGLTLGLIGFGRIPRRLVPKARAFKMRIIASDPYVDSEVFESFSVERVELDILLAESDVVSIHSSLTSETRHMLGLDQFKKMKPSAYLINTARGGLVNQRELHIALTNGHIAGAALDVTDPEPILPDDPLLSLDNVIVTAHSAHSSPLAFTELMRRPADEIARVLEGTWPVGLINPQVKETYSKKWDAVR
ncbi:C-terminal binding protein [Chloroflexota bacterium]